MAFEGARHGRDNEGLATRGVSYLVDAAATTGQMREALSVIADELRCNAVMLIGREPGSVLACARIALDLGLAVYLRLDATDKTVDQMLVDLGVMAQGAEQLREDHHHEVVTLMVGSELSHTLKGIVPGRGSFVRLMLIVRARRLLRGRIRTRLAEVLGRATAVARQHFGGPITYSAAAWEDVDWTPFDLVQARYLGTLIDLYDAEGVHGCFAFTYVMPGYALDDDPTRDLDKAGFALVVDSDGDLVRKDAFHTVAEKYARIAER